MAGLIPASWVVPLVAGVVAVGAGFAGGIAYEAKIPWSKENQLARQVQTEKAATALAQANLQTCHVSLANENAALDTQNAAVKQLQAQAAADTARAQAAVNIATKAAIAANAAAAKVLQFTAPGDACAGLSALRASQGQ